MIVPVLWQGMNGTFSWFMSLSFPTATSRPSTFAMTPLPLISRMSETRLRSISRPYALRRLLLIGCEMCIRDSRYVIWNNFGAEFEAPDLQAYQLSASLLEQLGISGGVITKYHQSYETGCTDQDYLDNLEMLEYDLLYGDQSGYEDGAVSYTHPALISADTSRMVRFSTGWRLTHRWRYTANASAITTEKNETQ